jgi:hypothetical protein
MQVSSKRRNADRCLPVLLWLQKMRHGSQTKSGRLLCILFLRKRQVSAHPTRSILLLRWRYE